MRERNRSIEQSTRDRRLAGMFIAAVLTSLSLGTTKAGDPTRPPDFQHPPPAQPQPLPSVTWQLSSVLVSGQRRIAILNGRTVTEGDVIEQAEVVSIEPDRVLLRRQGQKITVVLAKRDIKRSAAEIQITDRKKNP